MLSNGCCAGYRSEVGVGRPILRSQNNVELNSIKNICIHIHIVVYVVCIYMCIL